MSDKNFVSEGEVQPDFDLAEEVRTTAYTIMFSAMAVASSTVLLVAPNLETLTVVFFLVSYRYGLRYGIPTALISTTVFEIFASMVWGSAGIGYFFKLPPYLLTVTIGWSLGRDYRNKIEKDPLISQNNSKIHTLSPWYFGLTGAILTICYDVFTNLAFFIFVPEPIAFAFYFLTALPFAIFHEITNFMIFLSIPAINRAMDSAREVY